MASTFTPNIQLEEPARGDQVGTWDTPVNSNMTLADLVLGGIATISGAGGSLALAAAQFQCKTITVNSTLLASITVTFPTSFKKSYEIRNACTGSSAFTITLQTTAAAGQKVCAPPGDSVTVINDGANILYHSMDRVGTYWDYAGSSIPNWVSGCTIPPYLNCDGSAVSSGTYPALFGLMTTLPDSRGRSRFAIDPGVGRLSSAVAGFSPTTVGAAGGDQNAQTHSHGITDIGHTHSINLVTVSDPGTGGGGTHWSPGGSVATGNSATGITINSVFSGTAQNIPPAYIGGLTLIRAA